jgi:cyclic pyranopterin phosphate synthase
VNDDEIESMVDFAITKGIDVRFIETMPICR